MIDLQQKILERHRKAGNRCEYINVYGERCNNPSVQIAHRVVKGKTGRRVVKKLWFELFGEQLKLTSKKMDDIIHHKINTGASCIKHNDSFLVGIWRENKIKEMLKEIYIDLKQRRN